jgi:hypothetical protein
VEPNGGKDDVGARVVLQAFPPKALASSVGAGYSWSEWFGVRVIGDLDVLDVAQHLVANLVVFGHSSQKVCVT